MAALQPVVVRRAITVIRAHSTLIVSQTAKAYNSIMNIVIGLALRLTKPIIKSVVIAEALPFVT